jgi:5-methylcytosine-specific restriction endonuclease McrA
MVPTVAKWPYSTTRWQRLRTAHLSGEPYCRYCKRAGRIVRATEVDHIVPIRENRDGAFDADNLQSLCAPCHNRVKQQEERADPDRGCDTDGIPLKGWE